MKKFIALVLSLVMVFGLATTAAAEMEQLDNLHYVVINPETTDAATDANTTGSTTIESAKTFDAGIAMYVGMSVMAAAGSAVVLKKKD